MKPKFGEAIIFGFFVMGSLYLASFIPVITVWGISFQPAGLALFGVIYVALFIQWVRRKRKE